MLSLAAASTASRRGDSLVIMKTASGPGRRGLGVNLKTPSAQAKGTYATTCSRPCPADQVKAALQLDALQAQNRLDVRVIETTVTTGKGIEAGFQWLTDKVDYM